MKQQPQQELKVIVHGELDITKNAERYSGRFHRRSIGRSRKVDEGR